MDNVHIVKAFDQDIELIQSMILEMGGLVEIQISQSINAFGDRDVELAEKVRADDKAVDVLDAKINELYSESLKI